MDTHIGEQLSGLELDYQRRKDLERDVWAGFDERSRQVTDLIEGEFRQVAREVLGENVEIGEVKVSYNFNHHRFNIDLNGGTKIVEGRRLIIGRDACAYIAYHSVVGYPADSRIERFSKEYVANIGVEDCYCGSDHR
ncbi:MAG: hypothetical protein WCI72_01580 [archaeon]